MKRFNPEPLVDPLLDSLYLSVFDFRRFFI